MIPENVRVWRSEATPVELRTAIAAWSVLVGDEESEAADFLVEGDKVRNC